MSNPCKKFQNPKIAGKRLSIGPQNFFYQNESEGPKMDYKHNFKKREIFYFLTKKEGETRIHYLSVTHNSDSL